LKNRYFELKNLIGATLLLLVVVCGCKMGDKTLGVDTLPGIKILDTRYYQDSTSIITSILKDDSIWVNRPTYNLLGSFNDPVFGRTDASFAAQFRLTYNPNYGANAVLDSIFLIMTYKKIYGDTLNRDQTFSTQTLKVYELEGDLSYESKYRSSYNIKERLANTMKLVGTYGFTPKFVADSLKTDTTEQVIKMSLDTTLGNRLLRIDPAKMKNNDEFLKVFKGLYISATPISQIGTLVSINASKSTSTLGIEPTILLYYHDSKSDTIHDFSYYVTPNSANVSSYFHDYTSAGFKPSLDSPTISDTLIYIQPTGGIKSKISIPSLSAWKDSGNYLINSAILTFHVDTTTSKYKKYSIPDKLYLILPKKDADGNDVFPADKVISSSYYGGFYDATTDTYSFNVTQHLQQLVNGAIPVNSKEFYLVHSDRNNTAQRVVLKGYGSKKAAPKLNVTYTRYK